MSYDFDQIFRCAFHLDTVRPDTPPERQLAIDAFRGSIGQNRRTRAIFGDQVRGTPRTGENHDGLDTGLFRESARGMADSVLLDKFLALWLTRGTIASLGFCGDTRHHFHSLNWVV